MTTLIWSRGDRGLHNGIVVDVVEKPFGGYLVVAAAGKPNSLCRIAAIELMPLLESTPDARAIGDFDATTWRAAVAKAEAARRLIALGTPSHGEVCAEALGLGIHPRTMYQYVATIRQTDHPAALIPSRGGRPVGTSFLDPAVEAAIEEAIDRLYLVRHRPPLTEVVVEIGAVCRSRQLFAPSLKAVRLRVDRRDAYEVLKKRHGSKKARYTLAPVPGSTDATELLELVEIDHTLADVILLSDTPERTVLGRPWVTLAIDVASRMIVGVHVTFNAPSATSVAVCMMNILCDKGPFLAWLGLEGEWPAFGVPTTIYVDNGKDFHSDALERGCQAIGANLQYRPVGSPHYGGIIERLIGTMMGKCRLLPGSTQRNVVERGESNPEAAAVMTLSEFRRFFVNEITTQYHLKPHRSLRKPPLLAWREILGKHGAPRQVAENWTLPELFVTFLPGGRRLVRRDGVRIHNLRYWHDALEPWIADKTLHLVHFDPRDISKIYVRAPSGLVVCAPCISDDVSGISLAEWDSHLRELRQKSADPALMALRDKGVLDRRKMIEDASTATRRARRDQSRRDTSLAQSPPIATPAPPPVPLRVPQLALDAPAASKPTVIFYDAELWT